MLKKLLPLLLILFFIPSDSHAQTSTWTWVQDAPMLVNAAGGSCQPPVTSCNIFTGEFAPTVAGSIWVIAVQTSNNVTMSNVTGGGGTWIHCPNCHVTNASGFNADAWYNLTGTAGTNQNITLTLSASSGAVFGVTFYELLPPAGSTASLDVSGVIADANCSTCATPTLNLSATDAVIINPGGASSHGFDACSAPYTTDWNGACIGLNVTAASPTPTKTFRASANPEFFAIAFKSTLGSFTPPLPSRYSLPHFSQSSANCTNCSITIPATTAGNLLFVQSASQNGAFITSVSGGGSGWVAPSGAGSCRIAGAIAGVPGASSSCAYQSSAPGGTTSLTVTMSGSGVTNLAVWEVASTSGKPFTIDTQGSFFISTTSAFYDNGPALTLTGDKDVVFQSAWIQGGSLGPSFYPLTNIPSGVISGVGGGNYLMLNQFSIAALFDVPSGAAPVPVWSNPQHDSVFVMGIAFNSAPSTISAPTCSQTDVQNALNQATTGTTVLIPAGTCTWTSTVSVSNGITIMGAGSQSIVGGGDVTVILDGVSHSPTDNPTLSMSASVGQSIRLSAITFKSGSGNAGSFNGAIRINGSTTSLRVDHSHFQVGPIQLDVGGPVGVIDHNIFDNGIAPGNVTNAVRVEHSSWLGVGSFGDKSWADATTLGSSRFLYMEDNVINGGFVNDCINGGRYVIRHNTINNATVQEHSTGSGQRHRACRAWEDYQNTYVCATGCTANGSGAVNFDAHFMTAGVGVVWGNTATQGYTNFATLRNNRSNNQTYGQTAPPGGWGYCGTAFNGTGSNWDQNTSSASGYACLDQIGRGVGDLLSGDFPPFGSGVLNTTTGTIAWPNQAQEPIYEWLNTWSPVPNSPGQFWAVAGGAVLAANRDYYNFTNSFNGTTGVGSGLLSVRPTTCTPGVAYWATNTNTLYQCSTSNVWTVYYTPYTYPHPLTGGVPTGPVADLYLAQAAAGLTDGSSCANARAVSYFNASGNWGTGLTQIGGGTTIHLCGTITSSLAAPASQGTGTITIRFESGASMQQPAAQNFISITGKTNSYIISGQAPCGFQNQAFVACTESIKNTANGSPSGFANSVTNIKAIDVSNTTGSVTVQNLEIGPLYVHNDIADASFTNGATLANAFVGDVMMGSLTVQDSYIHDTSFAFPMNPRQASATAPNGPPVLTIQRVEFFHNDHDIYLGPACNPSCYSVEIGWIHSHDHTNWNTTADAYHHDGIHIAGGQNTASQTNVHHSLFDGPWNGNGTDPIFNQVAVPNFNFYDNVINCTVAQGCINVPVAVLYGGGPNQLYANNTIIMTGQPRGGGPAFTNNGGIQFNNPSGNSVNVTHMNNIIDGAANEINFVNTVFAPNTATSGLDYNLYSNAITNGNKNFTWQGTLTDSFTTWQGLSGEGIHSQFVGNGLLAIDGTPQTGSAAIGTGTNLTSLCVGSLVPLCTDFYGTARPTSGAWNVGAIGNPIGGTPLAALSITTVAFFNQMAGTTTSLPAFVTLSNNGTASLAISSLSFTGTNPGDFGQTNNCGTGIAAGTSCVISITFSPSALGPRSAMLNVNDNASGSPQTVSLGGNGFKTIAGTGVITGTGMIKVN